LKVDYDEVASTYLGRYERDDYAGVGKAVDRLAADCATVLEVGCGTGHWLSRLRRPSRTTIGVDPSSEMLQRAPASLRESGLVRGRAEALPFADSRFDLVLAVNALHHFDSLHCFFAEASRVLRPGGKVAAISGSPSRHARTWREATFIDTSRRNSRYSPPTSMPTACVVSGRKSSRVRRRARHCS
jgi:ubiquinone/menaquinone biosynthesis C-methylase UbiE